MQRPRDPDRPAPLQLWVTILVTGAAVVLGGIRSALTDKYVWAGVLLVVGALWLTVGVIGLRQRARRPR